MEQNLSTVVQVALVAASGAIVVLVVVFIRALLKLERQCERVVIAVERVEAQVTPLARETRVAVDRLSDLSGSAQTAVEVAGDLILPPVWALGRVVQVARTGVTTFLQTLLSPHTR